MGTTLSRAPRRRLAISFVLLFAASGLSVRAENIVRIGRTEGRPGETVRLPVTITHEDPLLVVVVSWAFDDGVLTPIPPSIEGTASGELPVELFTHRVEGDGWARAFIRTDIHDPPKDRLLPPGEEQRVLWIRFRIHASAPAGETAVHCHGATEVLGGTTLVRPDARTFAFTIHDGAVTVLPPEGPRPPEILGCTQVLARVDVAWENPESYDAIRVERDGSEVATLPGDARAWSDPSPPQGGHVYRFADIRGGERSIATACEIEVGPAVVEKVRALACAEDGGATELSWASGGGYDAILVRRDGADLATLPGSAASYRDAVAPEGATLYEVIGLLGGYASPAARCVARGSFILRIGDVRAEPGQKGVRIPIFATTMEPLQASSLCVIVPKGWLAGGDGYAFEGTLTGALGYDHFFPLRFPDAMALFIYHDDYPPIGPTCFPPSVEAAIAQIVVDVPDSAARGRIIPIAFGVRGDPGVLTVLVPIGARSVRPETIPGQLVIGETGVASVVRLRSDRIAGKGPRNLRLSWRNPEAYDRIVVERNGEPSAELPGDAVSLLDEVERNRVYHYRVVAFRGERQSFPTSLTISTLPSDMVFRRGDANADGWVNVADAVAIVVYLYAAGHPPACLDAADADDSGRLDLGDPIFLLNYLFAGGPVPPTPGPRAEGFDPTPDRLECP